MATCLDTLPIELLRHIFTFIDNNRTRNAVVKTCKKFHEELEESLYNSIEVSNLAKTTHPFACVASIVETTELTSMKAVGSYIHVSSISNTT